MNSNCQSTISGPALTKHDGYSSSDIVFAFQCICQRQLLFEWIHRPRQHTWPSRELMQAIPKLPAYLVPAPVGCKSSENKHMEWRVCFTGEQKLIESFTESQYKLYILLKLINKHELKSICEDMSSYVMKNIVFWLVESKAQHFFTRENLFVELISSLHMLQQAIRDNHLFYYMIAGRNLLKGIIKPAEQRKLIEKNSKS
ncbi:LOW QUALITY PROTEIN: hypothetical protein MAR_032776 [Mya arenaria]|uniref:Mab-21-like HhH/H2TH-like domain-containing protein n=1 Tax=Mya arenaria TaxID=6604 RepID=A0ABY7GA69_MYAAR|nr:LOW QUALITY PROTEIN: hypothetical protein MAR_032776 [Mya arenaria]